jgi:hypothetical protein
MDTRHLVSDALPGVGLTGLHSPYSNPQSTLTREEVAYLYNLTGDEDLSPQAYASSKDMAIDAHMTGFVRRYQFEDCVMANRIIAPIKQVRSRVGTYKTRDKSALDVDVSDEGAQDGSTNEIHFRVGEGTYTCENRKLKIYVDDDEIMERGALDPMQEGTILLKHGIELRQEIRIRNLAEATTNAATIGTDWDTSDAIHTDITTNQIAFEAACGMPATHAVINSDVAGEILANQTGETRPLFGAIPMLKGVSETLGSLGWMNFPKYAWGMRIIVTNCRYNSAIPLATRVAAYIWPDAMFMFRVDNATRATTWAIQPTVLKDTIVRWRDEDRGGWYIKIVRKQDEVEVTSDAVRELADVT